MSLTTYRFRSAISAFFEIETETAREFLPAHLHPLEVQHGAGVFSVTAFDFSDSLVGAYQEIVLAIIVPPLVKSGDPFPKSAQFPFLLGTSTEASREHAIERWHLPHYMRDIGVEIAEANGSVDVRVQDGGAPVLDFRVTDHEWDSVNQLHQCFTCDREDRFKVDIHMEGTFTEHEEERGTLTLHEHPMCEKLLPGGVSDQPFRELWMKDGIQTFEELETL